MRYCYFGKCAWIIPSKDKERTTITKFFQKNLNKSNRKPSKIWVDNGSELYNRSIKSFLQNSEIEMNSTHNEGKSDIAERFIKTFKNKIYKHMTSISKNVYVDKLDDIVNKYDNTYHRTIKMKLVDIKSSTYTDFNKENNKEGPKFKVGNHLRISKYKSIFAKCFSRLA